MTVTVQTYLAYLVLSIGITIWVARVLSKNGRLFLVEVFAKNEGLADAVNQLLVVGFYLINFGFIAMTLKSGEAIPTMKESLEIMSTKTGTVLFILGAMHFTNLGILATVRRNHMFENRRYS